MKLNFFFHFNAFLFTSLVSLNLFASAEDPEKLRPLVSKIISEPFRMREISKISLDGTEAASGIQRASQITNEVVYVSPTQWRVRRELPFLNATKEYLFQKDRVMQMTPSNRASEPREAVSETVWMEALISPLRIAQQWSLAKSDMTLSEWISSLKGLKEPLKNAEGDQITAEFDKDQNVKINMTGKLIADAKTRVNIQSTYEILDRGKVTEKQLSESLMRSH
ncbi:MAG: hypothetical protein J0L93_10970 [Deltaproteobacteria bacterium]|nr:hypothetical protein [Deltaproteobacteria bacterium]